MIYPYVESKFKTTHSWSSFSSCQLKTFYLLGSFIYYSSIVFRLFYITNLITCFGCLISSRLLKMFHQYFYTIFLFLSLQALASHLLSTHFTNTHCTIPHHLTRVHLLRIEDHQRNTPYTYNHFPNHIFHIHAFYQSYSGLCKSILYSLGLAIFHIHFELRA